MNRQPTLRVPLRQLEEFTARVRRAVHLPAGCLTICLVSESEIAKWNRLYRNKKGPTDVLSFPTNDDKAFRARRSLSRRTPQRTTRGMADSYIGDIAIAPAVARRNARRFKRTFSEELRILILHGILHLMGYDHETEQDKWTAANAACGGSSD